LSARDLFEEAVRLWCGDPLKELSDFDFAAREADRLQELHANAIEGIVEARLALGEHREVIGQITGLVAASPLRERPRRLLMLALYRSGRHAGALAAYHDGRRAR
jgi:DNA-binding SARP family transcriptional activator